MTAGEPLERLTAAELHLRATRGAALLGARGALILFIGLGANIVLARLLAPREFGVVALGMVLVVVGGYLADGGLGAALIRRPEPPTRAELAAVNAIQLALAGVLAAVSAGAAGAFGRDGLVVAAMVAALPITVLRTPSVIVLERDLSYRAIATTDVAEAVAFYAWALATVALGLGVWGLASAVVVRAVAGTVVMLWTGPLGPVRPRWSWRHVRPLAAFGARRQAVNAIGLVRDQGINVAVAGIAGIATLGVWSLAWRVLQVPFALFTAVGRVSYPTMSRLLGAGEDPRRTIERGIAATAVATAVLLVAVVGFAPALPALVGAGWEDVPATLLWSSIALTVSAPVYVLVAGYLYAEGDAGAVLRAVSAQTVAWLAVTVPLLSTLGAPAVGIGSIAGGGLLMVLLGREAARRSGAAVASSLIGPVAIALIAEGTGWAVAVSGSGSVLRGVLGLVVGELVLLTSLAALRRSVLRDIYALMARAFGRGPRSETRL